MNCFGVKQVFWIIHVILKGSHAEIIYVSLGSKWGDMYTIKLGIKYQIENQDKSKNDLCEFIAKKVVFL